MTYYRVKKGYGGSRRWCFTPKGGTSINGEYIEDELYTATEVKKMRLLGYAEILEKVETPKSKTYFCFGARFSS